MTGPNLSDWALKHRSFIVFAMIAIVVAGLSSYFGLGRSEDPAFTFRTMVVQAAWPGATLNETLDQVTERLERKLQETKGLDFLRSYTSPGRATIFVNLKGSTSPKDVPDIWYQVRKNIGDIRRTLPQGVVGPFFNDDFGDTYGLIYGFTADIGFSQRELRDYVEDVRSKLLHVPDVSKIEILGAQDEQIYVEFSTSQLAGLGIDRAALIAAIRAQNAVIPAGAIQTGNEKISIRVTGAFKSANDLLDVNFLSNGRLIRLRDIAEVRRTLVDPPQPMFRVNGKPAIGLAIAMRDGGDILALGRNVKKTLDAAVADLPLGINVALVSDQPVVVQNAIGEFMESLWQAIAIIMAVSIVSLGFRPGAVVALSIPLTVAIIFPIMQYFDIDLQRISLGALIIALGLLVDDAMTTVDVMISRMAAGDSKEKAATFAYESLAFPMLTGSFITAAGFVPIGFAKSSAGEYTFSIFAVVSIALIVSWFVAVLFAPLLGVWLLKAPEKKQDDKPSRIMAAFRSLLLLAMRRRWMTVAVTLACFVASLLALPLVPRQFFPASDRPELVVDLTLPQSASIFATDRAAKKLDAMLKGNPDVASWSTYVGRGAIRFYLPLNVQLANDFFAQAVVIAKDVAARERLHAALEKKLADELPGVVSRVSPLELGPPVGWPVQYRVSGPDLSQVRMIALQLGAILGANDDLRRVNYDWMEPARQVRVVIDQDQARLLGLSSQALSSFLNTVMTGAPITQVRDDIYLVDVVARAQDEQRVSLDTLQSLQVPLPNGRTVPLSQIARFEYQQEYPLVWRRDRVPTLTVQADVVAGATPEAAAAALAPAVQKLGAGLPKGYHIAVGGTVEESAKSQASVFAKLPLMLFLMLLFLMAQLHSFSRLAMVLSLVPMGLVGVVLALLISGRPLGFVAILGILALMGMIARNAVILIEQIEAERAQGLDLWNAIVEGAMSRFRPIMLTAISTVLGFIPIAPTVFWGPMAFAIMGGLFVATILTLLVLPALYVIFFRVKEPTKTVSA
ncbi:efflux RND transporter permease subunit [Rhodoblastus acidophilus]|uniref:Efflux RND transporter permease subunit n=1 Tax=Candidatus Rhodoblastus alkanivorans TaxID=2954117 RepID=A0ABS9Z6S8_9HYPH|nr:efflux RND transporter permease subunit [Candidatus Rhodoblastus alkanivorans]MCI4680129.1 efflux RND transporter permease subunit [Candidatus Rhodoblastus alkanivorans]MCI4683383.1 efflux RND transporter permease subunit [Candidatus Rhodoblastus alkanivorans]MDI4640693.1 efflux RND transporter permease subunit [Rhodoblastus acidophilus]